MTYVCLPFFVVRDLDTAPHLPEEKRHTCTQQGHSLYLPLCPSLLVRSVMQCLNREGRRGKETVGTVTAAPVVHVYASALSHKRHSAIGPGAECSLTPVCRPRLSVAFHSPSLMLTPGLSAAACRHVSIFPFSLSLSGWDFSSSEFERNEMWALLCSRQYCFMHN